jgi:hypothetical protein
MFRTRDGARHFFRIELNAKKSKIAMRSLLLSALAATTVIAAISIGLTTDASAAKRQVRNNAPATAPAVPQNPSSSFRTYEVPVPTGRRDVNPISGTPRWNASGGAA